MLPPSRSSAVTILFDPPLLKLSAWAESTTVPTSTGPFSVVVPPALASRVPATTAPAMVSPFGT